MTDKAVDMHAIGADAKENGGRALQLEQRRGVESSGNRVDLVAPILQHSLLAQALQHLGDSGRAAGEVLKPWGETYALSLDDEGIGKAAQVVGEAMGDPADLVGTDEERPEVAEVVSSAGADAVEHAHAGADPRPRGP